MINFINKKIYLLLAMLFIAIVLPPSLNIIAQNAPSFLEEQSANEETEMCGVARSYKELYESFPEKEAQDEAVLLQMMQKIDSVITQQKTQKNSDDGDTIPVVFHYIYDCGDPDLLAVNAQAFRAINKLNEDFNGITAQNCMESDDCEVSAQFYAPANRFHFKLADKDPNGNPTIGITKQQSYKTFLGLGHGTGYKQIVQWPRNKYMNVYVVERATPNDNSGVSYYPTSSHSYNPGDGNELYDGPTIAAWAFDPQFDPNSTRHNYDYVLSHEVGHWLNLRHIWGGETSAQHCSNCNEDDFEFVNEFLNDYEYLFDNDYVLSGFNDTPNAIGNSTWNDCAIGSNSCPDAGEKWADEFCGEVIPSSESSIIQIDMYDNFMNYTPCASMFSRGQIKFMKLILQSSISDRNNLISETNLQDCFYLNNEPNMVLMEDAFVEDRYEDGCISGEIGIRLRNGLKFHSAYIDQTLSNSFYQNSALPNGLQLEVMVNDVDSATLILSCSSNLEDHETDLSFQFTLGANSNPFTALLGSINSENRTKNIRLDFSNFEHGVKYESFAYENYVGPEALSYKWIPIESENRKFNIFLIHNQNPEEYVIETSSGLSIIIDEPTDPYQMRLTKSFNDGQLIEGLAADIIQDGNTYLIDKDNLPFDQEAYFYLGFQLNDCESMVKTGWIRFQEEPTCDGIKIIDYAINNEAEMFYAGQIDQAVLRMNRSDFEQKSNLEFNEIKIDLVQTDPNQVFCTDCNLINGVDYEIELFSFDNSEINTSDFLLEILEPTKAVLSLSNAVNLNQNINVGLNLNNSCFENVFDLNDLEILVEPYLFEGPIYSNSPSPGFESGSTWQALLIGDVNQDFSTYQSQFGLYTYAATESSLGGFAAYVAAPFHYNAYCKNNSNELKLLDYLEEASNGEYKPVGTGDVDEEGQPPNWELYLSQEYLNTMLGEEKYISLQFLDDCSTVHYFWVKIYINSAGVVSIIDGLISQESDVPIGIGEIPSNDIACDPQTTEAIDYLSISSIEFVDEFLNVSGSNSYSDYSDLGAIDLLTGENYILNLEMVNDLSPNHSTGANWYVWIDFNEDGFYLPSEIVGAYHQEDIFATPFTDANFVIPAGNSPGIYTMRVILSLNEISSLNACQDFYSGEIEDYAVNIIEDCLSDKVLESALVAGNHQVENSITMQNNAFVSPQSSLSLKAGKYIEILPKTIVSKHSNFIAQIIPCGTTANKTQEAVLEKPAIVVDEISLKAVPNPFKDNLDLNFVLSKPEIIDINIFDFNGKAIVNLFNKERFDSGEHSIQVKTHQFESGVYFIRLKTQHEVLVRKVLKIE